MFSKLRPSRKATNATVDIQQSAKYANPLQTITRSSTKIFGGSEPKSKHAAEHTASSTPSTRSTFNVVLFGETGVGRSSVINLIARKEIAAVSSDANRCTMQYECYDILFDDVNFVIYDTFGLEEPRMGVNGYLKIIQHVYGLINKLDATGGIHLLLFCLRGGRVTATTQSNYLLFRECLCYGEVPTALVFTGLEREVEMEDWWRRNKKDIESYGIKSDGHACITAVQDDEDDRKFMESQVRIRQLLKECAIKHDPFFPETHAWFARFTWGMKGFIKEKRVPKEKQIMKVLMQRCKLDQETARKVAVMMENGDVEANKGEDSRKRSEDNGPRKETGPENNPTTLCSSPSEHAAPLAGILSNESVQNGRNKEDLRAMNGDDEPENGSEAVPGEPPRKENLPPKEHEDPPAGDGEKIAKKSIDEPMLNGHDQKGQQAGIKEGGQAETGEISTNGDSMLDEYGREEDQLSRKRRGSREKNNRSETGAPPDRVWNKPPFIDLTGRVTKSDHHPFASGSYGDIYRGLYHSDKGPINVAIKTTRMYLNHDQQLPKSMKRFRRELAVWQGLNHPNVLPFLGTIVDPSTNPIIPAMVCPLARNGPLTTYLVEESSLTFAKRLLLINNVAHGLQYLHSRKIVHGDLSGSNVLIDGEGTACIADFGLSTLLTRLGGSTFATTHRAKGTLRWMAPELFDFSDPSIIPTTQSDVYSFGCIVLQILTGNIPYHYLSNDPQVICAIVTGSKPARPDSEVVDDNKWKFIEWCWSPVKTERPRPSSDQIVGFAVMELARHYEKLSKC